MVFDTVNVLAELEMVKKDRDRLRKERDEYRDRLGKERGKIYQEMFESEKFKETYSRVQALSQQLDDARAKYKEFWKENDRLQATFVDLNLEIDRLREGLERIKRAVRAIPTENVYNRRVVVEMVDQLLTPPPSPEPKTMRRYDHDSVMHIDLPDPETCPDCEGGFQTVRESTEGPIQRICPTCKEARGKKMKPIYQHDCDVCEFIQNLTVEGTKYDVYRCSNTAIGESTWLARYGDEGSEYWSIPWDIVGTPLSMALLEIAKQREEEKK